MRKTIWLAILAVAAAPLAARAQDVSVDYDKAYDFSKIKTFSLQVGSAPDNPLQQKRVVAEVEQALTARGWTKAEPAAADAAVMLQAATQTKHDLTTMYSGYGGWRFGGMGTSQTIVQDYTVGTLVVDIFDGKTKSLLFRGVAKDELSDKPEKNMKKVEKATDKMFKNFPPGSAKK